MVSIDSVAEVIRGVTFSKTEASTEPKTGMLPVIRAGSIQQTLLLDKDRIWVPSKKIKPSQTIRKNDIVMCTSSGSGDLVGKCAKSDRDWNGSFGAFCVGIRSKETICDSSYLYHFFTSTAFKNWARNSEGINIKNIRVSELSSFEIPLPPLPEQKRIAAILDKADSLRRKNQQAIQLADKFLRAVFLDMFGDPVTNPKGWKAIKLGRICDVGSSKRVFVNEFTDAGIPFYRGTEVGKLAEYEDILPNLFISNDHYENLKKHSGAPEVGDLLLPSICHDGRIWKVDYSDPFYFKDGRVLWIKVNQNSISSDYLRSYLKYLFLANYSAIASGTTFAELKIINLKEVSVLNPPLDLQIKFSEVTNKVIKNNEAIKISTLKAGEMFSVLSQKAFAGEL